MIHRTEHELLSKILFSEQKLKKDEFIDIDFHLLVKIASSNLILPTLYLNLKSKNYSKHLPIELNKYLFKIYSLNKERNKNCLKEIENISSILKKNKIEYAFIKGASNLLSKLYSNIGERMIGDIDILINPNQKILALNCLKKAVTRHLI